MTQPYPTSPPPDPWTRASGYQKTSGLAVAGMVCGIVGIPLFWLYGILPVVAIVLSHVALHFTHTRNLGGRGMAIAGLATGYAGLGLLVIAVIGLIA